VPIRWCCKPVRIRWVKCRLFQKSEVVECSGSRVLSNIAWELKLELAFASSSCLVLEHAIYINAAPHLRPNHTRSLPGPSALLSTRPCRARVPFTLAAPPTPLDLWSLPPRPLRSSSRTAPASSTASSCSSSTTHRAKTGGPASRSSGRAPLSWTTPGPCPTAGCTSKKRENRL
jgi:hypothetical protein